MKSEPTLGALGISEFDERVYRLLLSRPDHRVSETARSLEVSDNRIRQTITRLAELGLLRQVTPDEYDPVRPDTALTALINRRRLEAEATLDSARVAAEDFAHLFKTTRLRDPGRWVEVLSGRETVNRRVDELMQTLRTHLFVFDRPP